MKRIEINFILMFLALIFLEIPISEAQEITQDSSIVNKNITVKKIEKKPVIIKSPTGAMVRSLIIPGWGQWYNQKKFKAILIFGTETGILINSIYLNQLTQKSTTDWEREYYLNNRNLSNWYLVGVILFSLADAFVDAHLSDFDESPDLSFMSIQPVFFAGEPGVRVSVNFAF